jgi:hypothetical protein
MSAVIGALRGVLSLDSAAFESGAKRSKATMGDLERRLVRLGSGFEKTGRRMALGLTLPMAGAAAVAVKSSLKVIDAQAKMAQSLGTTVTSMQVLERAADLSGVSLGEVQQATIQLTKRLSQATSGSGAAAKALSRLHLNARELQQLPLDERLAKIQAAMAAYIPDAERAAVASDLFGSRAGLIFTRIDGSALRTAAEDVSRFGLAVSEVDADQIEVTNDAISRLGLVGRGVANQLAVGLAPSLEYISDKAADAAEWFNGLGDRAKQFVSVGAAVTAAVGPLAIGLGLVLKFAVPVAAAIAAIVSPVGLAVAGFAALAAASASLADHFGGSVSFAEAHELAMDNVTIAMGDQISAAARLHDTLKSGGPVTLAAIEAKMAEAAARRAVVDELVRERQEKELEALGYYRVLEAIEAYRLQLDTISNRSTQAVEQLPAKLRASYEDAEEALAGMLVEQQRLLEGVRSQNHLTAEERAHLEQIQSNLKELQRRWNELNGITAESVQLTDRGVAAADRLAGSLGAAAGQAAAVRGYLASVPGALAAAQSNISGLKAGMAVLSAGGGMVAANAAKYRAELEASVGPLDQMQDGQRAYVQSTIDQRVQLYEQEQLLQAEYQKQVTALSSVKSAGGTATKSALAGLKKEIADRRSMLGLTEAQRKQLEAVRQVQQKLGKEGAGLSKAQISGLAGQVVELDNVEASMQRVKDLQGQWSEAITRTAFEGGSLGDTIEGMLRDIAYQFAHAKIVLPVVASVSGFLGLDQLLVGGGAAQAAGAASGGGSGLLSLLSGGANLMGGGGVISGIGSGLGGVLSGGGLGSSFANLGGLMTGASAGWGALGAALPALGIIVGLGAALKSAFSRKFAYSALEGNVTTDGFSGWGRDFYKGGLFRSDKNVHSALDADVSSALDDQTRSLTGSLLDMSEALGLGRDTLEDYKGYFVSVMTSGRSQQQIQDDLAKHFEIASDHMAEMILGTEELSKAGESATETLTRLATGLASFNDAMDLLGGSQLDASLGNADAASRLAEYFGGIEEMTATVNTYFATFYSEAEKAETLRRRALKQLRSEFKDLGLPMPKTREGFRDLVEGVDLATDAGRELYAGLLKLSAGLDQVLPKVGEFSEAMLGLVGRIGGEIDLQIGTARDMARISEQSAQLWYRTAGTLRDFLGGLVNTDLTAASAEQATQVQRSRLEGAFAKASSGDVQAAQDIPGLARAYLQTLRAGAGSSLEYRRAAAQVQGQVNLAAGIADLEGANEDMLRGLYEQQIEVLTNLGQFLQLEGLTADQVSQLSTGVQDLAADWDGTVDAFESALGALGDAIKNAEAFSYDDLVGRLDVAVALDDNAPEWLTKLVGRADSGIRTTLDFVIRNDELSPADKWIATNALSEHVAALDLVLREDLDGKTRRLVLKTTGGLRRDLRLQLAQDLDADTRQMVLTRAATLSRRVNVALTREGGATVRQLNRLQDLIGTEGGGKITFDGGLSFAPDTAFGTLFEDVAASSRGLINPMDKLSRMLGRLQDAVNKDRKQRETVQKLAKLQVKGSGAMSEYGGMNGQTVIDEIRALEKATGVKLNSGHTLKVGKDGRIQYSADSIEQSAGSDLDAWRKKFWADGGLEDKIFDFNRSVTRIEKLRQQVRDLGAIPQFATGGRHYGGARIVGERGWEIENTGSSRIHSHAESMAMLDNRPLAQAIDAFAKTALAQGQRMELFVRKISQFLEDWDEAGQPAERV